MGPAISRRHFLKGGLAVACGLASSTLPNPAVALENNSAGHIATLLDIRKCVGCEACVEACREANTSKYPDPHKPFPKMVPGRVPVEDWSDKQDITDLFSIPVNGNGFP